MNRHSEYRLGAEQAALKPPALQTLARGPERPAWREAFGVRAALAPLLAGRASTPRFRGPKHETPFRGILTPALSPLRGVEGESSCSPGVAQAVYRLEASRNHCLHRAFFFFAWEITFLNAASRAAFSTSFFAEARQTFVAPRSPQTPLQGLNTPGAFFMNE